MVLKPSPGRRIAAAGISAEGLGMPLEKATFGAGCFWHTEEAFRHLKGVKNTVVGFMGGTKENPSYEDVCAHTTGHAEVVEVLYDPNEISYEKLLDVFWMIHNPTLLNRQGPDVGEQYRSVIFYHTSEQEAAARAAKGKLEKSGKYKHPKPELPKATRFGVALNRVRRRRTLVHGPIVTEIVPASTFWKAEEYHQQYLEKNGLSSCPR